MNLFQYPVHYHNNFLPKMDKLAYLVVVELNNILFLIFVTQEFGKICFQYDFTPSS
jgi:hypothetical protein